MQEEPEYKPGAYCEDCGEPTIIVLEGKPIWEECDGFCDKCGAVWFNDKKTKLPSKSWLGHPGIMKTPIVIKTATLASETPLIKFQAKEVNEPKSNIYASPYPDDYNECAVCGYDHKYDAAPAARKHG